MDQGAHARLRTGPSDGAWTRVILVTLGFIALVQVCLIAAGRLVPSTGRPGRFVATEITAIAVAEFATVLLVWKLSRSSGRSLRSLGLWRKATTYGWLAAIGLGILTAFWGLSNPALHLSSRLGALVNPQPWHVYSALVAGVAGGFCEEIIFRGFVMQELAAGGRGRWAQVLGSTLLFAAAHAGLLRSGIVAGLLVIVPTAVLGALYCLIYMASRRSLMPVIVSHFLNDVAVIPWVLLAVVRFH